MVEVHARLCHVVGHLQIGTILGVSMLILNFLHNFFENEKCRQTSNASTIFALPLIVLDANHEWSELT